MLSSLIREASFLVVLRLTIECSAVYACSIPTSPIQVQRTPQNREFKECKAPKMGESIVKHCSGPHRALNSLTHSSYGYLYRICIRSNQSKFQQESGRDLKAFFIVEEILVIDHNWGKLSHLGKLVSFGEMAVVGRPCPSGWWHTREHMGTNWTQGILSDSK